MTYVFDLCGTLVVENTTFGYLNYLHKTGFRKLIVKFATSRLLGFFNRFFQRDLTKSLALRSLKGVKKEKLIKEGKNYAHFVISQYGRTALIELLKQYKQSKVDTYLATASLEVIADPISKLLNFTDYISSQLEFNDKTICTGRLKLDLTGNKYKQLLKILPHKNQESFIVYSDNKEDTDLFLHAERTYFLGKEKLPSNFKNITFYQEA